MDIDYRESIASPKPGGPSTERKDEAYAVLGDATSPTEISLDEDRLVLRKIDLWLMPIIVMVYFLQQLDKYVFCCPCD